MKKVITYGTYDLFHQGHYNLLKRAKELGDYLIVGVTSDYFDKSRGKFNVRDSLMTRIENVKATGFADEIVVEEYFGQKIDDIKKYGVDIFTVGSDWKGYFDYLNEYCHVIYLERTKGISSTQIRNINNLRLGIVGNESVLDRFLDELKFVSGVEVAGVYYAADEEEYSEYKSIKYKDLERYETYGALLSCADAVYINAPLHERLLYIEKAIKTGKHVLTEFPFCSDYQKAKKLMELAQKQHVILMEGLKTAYCPAFGKMVSLARSGQIGKLVNVEANFTQILGKGLNNQIRIAGGSMESLAAYPLLAIFKLLGTNYKRVSFVTQKENHIDMITKLNFIYEDAMAGAIVSIRSKAEGDLVISGTKGYIYVPAPWWKTEFFEVRYEDVNKNRKYFYKFDGEGLRYEIVEFLYNIRDSRNGFLMTEDEVLAECKAIDQFLSNVDVTVLDSFCGDM